MKKVLTYLSIFCIFILGCSKGSKITPPPQKTNPETPVIKIALISGNNQTDTVGNPLHNPIVVEVTEDGTPKSGYTIQFQGSGCNESDTVSTPSGPDGTTNYTWSLAGEVGQQKLKAYVLNSKNQKVDSVTIQATALNAGPGWHRSGCSLQAGSSPATFCKLSTGRLFTCFPGGKTFLRYSDDNGVSWFAVKSLGNNHTITWVLSTPSDEVLAFTEGTDGTFYSSNGGQTWSNLGVPPFNTELFSSIVCTRSGKLIATTALDPPVSISTDKGKTWSTVPFSAFIPQNMVSPSFHDPVEDLEGNLYVIELQDENLFKSKNLGKTWSLVPNTPTSFPGTDNSFYVDNNDWFYRSIGLSGYGVFISKDKGSTYTQLIPYAAGKMSVQSDGNLYYIAANKLFEYDFSTSLPKQIFGDGLNNQVLAYILAKNNNIIVDNLGNKYILYHTN